MSFSDTSERTNEQNSLIFIEKHSIENNMRRGARAVEWGGLENR